MLVQCVSEVVDDSLTHVTHGVAAGKNEGPLDNNDANHEERVGKESFVVALT